MSLVIAGYDYESFYNRQIYNGIFAIADSAITAHQGGKTILNGFRKVYELEAKIWKPNFTPIGTFRDYALIYRRIPFLIGFAGSTLTAQHILNSITEHLEKLRISYSKSDACSPIEYNIINHCQKNLLTLTPIHWDDSFFVDNDFIHLVTGKRIAELIEHSINHALKSASSYKLDIDEFKAMYTDIFCGIWCPDKKEHEIYIYRMKSKPNKDKVLFAYTEKELLAKDKIAVLGMRKEFEERAQFIYKKASKNNISPSEEAYNFLNECVDEVQDKGSKEIDRPISFRKLVRGKINSIHS